MVPSEISGETRARGLEFFGAGRFEFVLALVVWVLVAGSLFRATTEQSLTVDEPFHLLAGLLMHEHGQNLVNLEHPPLIKWLAAWPLADEPLLQVPAIGPAEVMATWHCLFTDPATTFRFLWHSRAILVLLIALPLLLLTYFLGKRFGGERTGLVLAAFVGLASTSLPYLVLSQTDAGVALFFVATLLMAFRFVEVPSAPRAAWLGAALGLALAAKFSAVLLLPSVLLAAFRAPLQRRRKWVLLCLVFLVAAGTLWSTYKLANLHYESARGRQLISDYAHGKASLIVGDRLEPFETFLLDVETFSPELAQYLTGFLGVRAQNDLGVYATVVFGQLTSKGRWYFFPLQLLTLTSLVLLGASLASLLTRRRASEQEDAPNVVRAHIEILASVLVVYLGVALLSSYNVGIRHLLPIFSLLCLPAARWSSRYPRRALVVVVLLAAESWIIAPNWISATNTWWLGELNPTRTAYSTMAYKQSYYALAAELEQRKIDNLQILQPIVFDAELQAYIPGATALDPAAPLESGWYGVYIQAEQLLPAVFATSKSEFYHFENYRRAGRPYFERWQEIRQRGEDHGLVAGNTFHLYRIP